MLMRNQPWFPPIRLFARPSTADLQAFCEAAQDAQLCTMPGSVDDIPPRWLVNHHERIIGHGGTAFARACTALDRLACLELPWLTHCVRDDVLAVCSRQFGIVWLMNANRIVARTPSSRRGGANERSITWATTRRHVLCGEERLRVHWDKGASDEVRFEVLSFSRPRHVFAWASYPVVVAQQLRFARDAADTMSACQSACASS